MGIETGGSTCHIVQHFYAHGSIAWSYSEFQQFVYGWTNDCMPHLLAQMSDLSSFTTCRLARFGPLPYVYFQNVAENSGAEGQPQSLNSALCLTWKCYLDGSSSRAHNRLPLKADAVDPDKRRIQFDFWELFQLECNEYVAAANSIVIASFDSPEFVVVSRSSHGAPRAASVFSPVVSGEPSLWVGTLASRTRSFH